MLSIAHGEIGSEAMLWTNIVPQENGQPKGHRDHGRGGGRSSDGLTGKLMIHHSGDALWRFSCGCRAASHPFLGYRLKR